MLRKRATCTNISGFTLARNLFCTHCDYRTVRKGDLKYHVNKNMDCSDRFKFDYCDYETLRKIDLKFDQKIHTSDKLFKCDQCNYNSVQRGGLNEHLKIHTGEKPFKSDNYNFRTTYKYKIKLRNNNVLTRTMGFLLFGAQNWKKLINP